MLYQRGSFTVPATGKSTIDCKVHGHAMIARGRCVRCGEKPTMACDEKEHRFNGDELRCACGTTLRRRTVVHHAHSIDLLAKR